MSNTTRQRRRRLGIPLTDEDAAISLVAGGGWASHLGGPEQNIVLVLRDMSQRQDQRDAQLMLDKLTAKGARA